ncbi:hypothetical protein Tsubulata_040253 [Turnera subulata]|uniref:DUF4283 domain-containing protein n=1 Tax=Turnera subulata TaxID=218843 RepID=A0A9Q0EZG5_9ROSI|nr:hypothetical protein Tsubulata_040253 [Turnera subulata]
MSFTKMVGVIPSVKEKSFEAKIENKVSICFKPKADCIERLKVCAFGTVKDGVSLMDVAGIFKEKMKVVVDVKAFGGRYVLIAFVSRADMFASVECRAAWMSEMFEFLKEWTKDDHASHRVCWLNVYGTPHEAWCPEFFRHIATYVGEFLQLHNGIMSSNCLEMARVQILTTFKEPISRSFKVSIDSRAYDVFVVEVQPSSHCSSVVTDTINILGGPMASDRFMASSSSNKGAPGLGGDDHQGAADGRCKKHMEDDDPHQSQDPFMGTIRLLKKGKRADKGMTGGRRRGKQSSSVTPCTEEAGVQNLKGLTASGTVQLNKVAQIAKCKLSGVGHTTNKVCNVQGQELGDECCWVNFIETRVVLEQERCLDLSVFEPISPVVRNWPKSSETVKMPVKNKSVGSPLPIQKDAMTSEVSILATMPLQNRSEEELF